MATRVKLTPVTKAKALQDLQNAPLGHYYMPPVPETRSLAANRRLWAMLNDIARQHQWPVNGDLEWIAAEDYKDIFTAALRRDNREAQGLYSGSVMLGASTSKMSVKEMNDLMALIEAWSAEQGIQLSEPEIFVPEQHR